VFVFGFIPLRANRRENKTERRMVEKNKRRDRERERERDRTDARRAREIEIIARDEVVFLVEITVSRLAIFHAAKYCGGEKRDRTEGERGGGTYE